MASPETPPPSIRQGVRIVPPDGSVTVEEVLLAVGEQVGHDSLVFASRMNKAVVVFLRSEPLGHQLVESGVFIRDGFIQVSPLSVPSTRITVSSVPPFIPNGLLETELRRFGKFASGFKTVSLGCKDPKLKHVQSLRRQVFMFLDSPTQTLEVSFRVKHGDGSYMVFASSGQLKCFECGHVGHKRFVCPLKQRSGSAAAPGNGSAEIGPVGPVTGEPDGTGDGPAAGEPSVGASVVPVGTSMGPVGASVVPVGTSVVPVGASVVPVGMSVVSDGTPVAPVGTSVVPVGTPVAPVGTLVVPVGASVALEGASVVPVGTSTVPVVGGSGVAGCGAVSEAASATAPQGRENGCRKTWPGEQQASVSAVMLSSSQSAGADGRPSQSAEQVEEAVKGHEVVSSQISGDGEEMDYDSESDTVSIGEISNKQIQ